MYLFSIFSRTLLYDKFWANFNVRWRLSISWRSKNNVIGRERRSRDDCVPGSSRDTLHIGERVSFFSLPSNYSLAHPLAAPINTRVREKVVFCRCIGACACTPWEKIRKGFTYVLWLSIFLHDYENKVVVSNAIFILSQSQTSESDFFLFIVIANPNCHCCFSLLSAILPCVCFWLYSRMCTCAYSGWWETQRAWEITEIFRWQEFRGSIFSYVKALSQQRSNFEPPECSIRLKNLWIRSSKVANHYNMLFELLGYPRKIAPHPRHSRLCNPFFSSLNPTWRCCPVLYSMSEKSLFRHKSNGTLRCRRSINSKKVSAFFPFALGCTSIPYFINKHSIFST